MIEIFSFQISRPITLKKDNIQTRNRKLAAKAKKRARLNGMGIAGMAGLGAAHDFFKSPLTDSRFSAYSGIAAAGMNPSSYLASAAAASNPMSQYYASGLTGHASYRDHATAAAQMNQFMSTASNYGLDRYGMTSTNPYVGHPGVPTHSAFPFGSGSGAAGNSTALSGGLANATSPMIAAGATA